MARATRLVLATALVLVAAAGAVKATEDVAQGASTSRLSRLSAFGDQFWNYDFTTNLVRSHKVDWPIALVFYGNATINKVKSFLGNPYDQAGSRMFARLNDGSRWRWDTDKGRKTTICPGAPFQPTSAKHYRVYADADDRLFNTAWGFYVIGSTHYDVRECGFGAAFGWSETAEGWLTHHWRVNGGWAQDDWRWFGNPEPDRTQGNHIWQNDGKASRLYVR